ncbi:hypothetical protein [Gaoshiqia sediminis]|uniref:4-O-methyl-glucuronoyl methylesterase-like domain-containing protein n=1 Tax=Gaoshiqia sediminis TaxID=2986998 RepID=A0AA41YEU7_9BACT|nr:hypothetical protein [Gaoshiqia sediminis]MCW0484692.1 hypothetical protein [Gaoshiqia sediminis]
MKKLLTFLLILIVTGSLAQRQATIYDEENVPEYQLPPLLKSQNGRNIKKVKQWEKIRRPELLRLFSQEVYGKIPGEIPAPEIIIHETNGSAFYGKAVRKQVELVFSMNDRELPVNILMYLPAATPKAPVFLGYNFLGNHSVADDPNIRLTESWVYDHPSLGIVHNQVTEQSRGVSAENWPIEMILDAGFGLVTVYYGDVDPDRDNFSDGIHPFHYKAGQEKPRPDEWGSMAAWAWGLSRVMDYLEADELVNAQEVILLGHSRLGKAALWAAASDPRFAMCISNNSGCMGAALSRRRFGETVAVVNSNFPHWFCGNFKKYSGYEDELPVDQHMLLALIAPRPLYVASATEDQWADPLGEFLSAKQASEVYQLFGVEGLTTDSFPAPDQPVFGRVSYHIRTGKHDITPFDWEQYLKFAQQQLEPE